MAIFKYTVSYTGSLYFHTSTNIRSQLARCYTRYSGIRSKSITQLSLKSSIPNIKHMADMLTRTREYLIKEAAFVIHLHVHAKSLQSCQLFVTLGTVARQAPPSMGLSRQEYRSGLPSPPPGDLPKPGIKPISLMSSTLVIRFLTTSVTWEAQVWLI